MRETKGERGEVRKGLEREMEELEKEREEEEERNLGEKRMLGLEEIREAEEAEQAMSEKSFGWNWNENQHGAHSLRIRWITVLQKRNSWQKLKR